MTNHENKIVWVTGGSRGIGKATAIEFAKMGSKVVISSRSQQNLDKVASEIIMNGGKALALACDVSDAKSVRKTVTKIEHHWGPVELLINNAGIAKFTSILETSEQDWDDMMAINAKSAFLCSQAVLPCMLKNQSGYIINMVSVAGNTAFTNCGGYCASKHAMLGFTNVLRKEVRESGIKVTAILPGATETAIWGNADVPNEKMMRPHDIAKIIVGVCTDSQRALQEEIILRPIGGDL